MMQNIFRIQAGKKIRPQYFTLIELLVVIAIIAILASILMPALSAARERGRVATCVSNIKTIASACGSYSSDNSEFLVPEVIQCKGWNGAKLTDFWWYGGLVRLKYLPFSSWQKDSDSPNKVLGVLRCPSETRNTLPDHPDSAWNSWKGSHYGFANYIGQYIYGAKPERYFFKVTELKMPSKNAHIGDKGIAASAEFGVSLDEILSASRHTEKMNVAFVDQHVETREYTTIPVSSWTGYLSSPFHSRKDQQKNWGKYPW